MSFLRKKSLLITLTAVILALGLQSCGSRKYLVVPHSVSTASAVTVDDLNLKPGDYEILKTVSETASVLCEYKNSEIKITSEDGDFSYTFEWDSKFGKWSLKSFAGAAAFGYFKSNYEGKYSGIPDAEEFARRVAMSRIIAVLRDYDADAVIEPVCVTRVSNEGRRSVIYSTTVTAKLIQIKVK